MRARHRAAIGALAATAALGAAQPASAQFFPGECVVSGGGQIRPANGDQATFGGNADSDRLVVHQVYIDHGPVQPFQFRALTMNAMICDLDARRAEFTGQGQVTTALGIDQLVQYRIAVFALRQNRLDTYRITLSNGYDSGEQVVVHGNITLRGEI